MGASESADQPGNARVVAPLVRRRQSSAVKVHLRADSPLGRGLKSLLSEPLDGLVTPDGAWKALECLLRSGSYALGAGSSAVGNFRSVDFGGGTFLTEWTIKTDSGKEAPIILLHELDGRSREWIMRKYTTSPPMEDCLEITHFVKFHRSPLRVESWSARRGSTRRPTGAELRPGLEAMLKEVLQHAKVPPRRVGSTVRSWGAVSEPIEELTPASFWKAHGAVARREADEARKAGAKLSPVPGGFAISKGGLHWSARLDKKRDEWHRTEHGADASMQQVECVTVMKVHQDPFRVQVWSEQPLVRFPGSPELRDYLQELLAEIVDKARGKERDFQEEELKAEV